MKNEREAKLLDEIKGQIKCYPDFPKKGILFRDMFSVLRTPENVGKVVELMVGKIRELGWTEIDTIVGIESRGFILGPLLSLQLNAGFVPSRKQGKLPGPCKQISYTLEYRSDILEIQEDSIKPGQRVLVIDDLIATGGSLQATCDLIKSVGGIIVGCLTLIELEELNGRSLVNAPVESLMKF